MTERPPRILFFLYHAGYLRHYAEALRLLAREGAVVHLAFTVVEKDAGDTALAERLAAEFPAITFGPAPIRAYFDGWRRTSTLVRALHRSRPLHAPALRGGARPARADGREDPAAGAVRARATRSAATWSRGSSTPLARRSDATSARAALSPPRRLRAAIPTSRADRRASCARSIPTSSLATPLVEYASNQVDYLKSARGLGVADRGLHRELGQPHEQGDAPVHPGPGAASGTRSQRRELEELHGIDGARAVVTGAQKFDEWFERAPTPDAGRAQAAGRPRPGRALPALRLLVALHRPATRSRSCAGGSPRSAPIRASTSGKLGVVVRPHPQNSAQWHGVDLAELANVVVWPGGGAQPDAGDARADFFDSLAHARPSSGSTPA